MLATMALAFGSPAAVAAPEIVVIERRLESVTVRVGQEPDGKWYCSMDGSIGIRSLDERVCKAVSKCVRKGASTDDAVQACVTKSKRRLFEKFKREQERSR